MKTSACLHTLPHDWNKYCPPKMGEIAPSAPAVLYPRTLGITHPTKLQLKAVKASCTLLRRSTWATSQSHTLTPLWPRKFHQTTAGRVRARAVGAFAVSRGNTPQQPYIAYIPKVRTLGKKPQRPMTKLHYLKPSTMTHHTFHLTIAQVFQPI